MEQTLGLPVVDRRAALFIGYQVHRIVLSPTLGLGALTGFDIGIVALTWREYLRQRVYRVGPAAGPELPPVITPPRVRLEDRYMGAHQRPVSDNSDGRTVGDGAKRGGQRLRSRLDDQYAAITAYAAGALLPCSVRDGGQ